MSKKETTVTCGVIVTDTRSYLICHPTRSKWWDIPKGQMEKNETYGAAAARELQEETGIRASLHDMSYLGTFDYKPTKKLALYYYQVDTMFDVTIMSCSAMVEKNGKTYPEMDKFLALPLSQMLEKVSPALAKVLKKVLK